jgi:hypothetical protein
VKAIAGVSEGLFTGGIISDKNWQEDVTMLSEINKIIKADFFMKFSFLLKFASFIPYR